MTGFGEWVLQQVLQEGERGPTHSGATRPRSAGCGAATPPPSPNASPLIAIPIATYLGSSGVKAQSNLIRWLEKGVYSQIFKSFIIFNEKSSRAQKREFFLSFNEHANREKDTGK